MDACLMRSKNMHGEGWIGEERLWGIIMDVKKIQRNRMKKKGGWEKKGGGGQGKKRDIEERDLNFA